MSEIPDPTAPPSTAPAPSTRPRKFHLAWLIFGGLLLAIGGCGMFLANLNLNSSRTSVAQGVGGVLFGVGLLAFVIGLGIAIVRGLARLVQRK